MAKTGSGDSHQDFPGARLFGLHRFDPQFPAGFGQNGGTESQRHWRSPPTLGFFGQDQA
jgi:hypothetical protein